jgi:hypothetical protein
MKCAVWSDREIARQSRVSNRFVTTLRSELMPVDVMSAPTNNRLSHLGLGTPISAPLASMLCPARLAGLLTARSYRLSVGFWSGGGVSGEGLAGRALMRT